MNLEKKSVVGAFRVSVNDILELEKGESIVITIDKERYKIKKEVNKNG